jgi:hypothetical protein
VSVRTGAELARKEDFVGRSLAGPSTGGTDAGVELPRPRAGLMSLGDSWLRLRGGLCNALNLGVDFFSSFLSPNSGVTLSFSLFFSLSLDLFQKL